MGLVDGGVPLKGRSLSSWYWWKMGEPLKDGPSGWRCTFKREVSICPLLSLFVFQLLKSGSSSSITGSRHDALIP